MVEQRRVSAALPPVQARHHC